MSELSKLKNVLAKFVRLDQIGAVAPIAFVD